MANCGPLAAEIVSLVWGTPDNFNGFRSVTARHFAGGLQPKFAALNRGRHLYSTGRPSRWALAHILVDSCFFEDVLFFVARKCLSNVSLATELTDRNVTGQCVTNTNKSSAAAEMSGTWKETKFSLPYLLIL